MNDSLTKARAAKAEKQAALEALSKRVTEVDEAMMRAVERYDALNRRVAELETLRKADCIEFDEIDGRVKAIEMAVFTINVTQTATDPRQILHGMQAHATVEQHPIVAELERRITSGQDPMGALLGLAQEKMVAQSQDEALSAIGKPAFLTGMKVLPASGVPAPTAQPLPPGVVDAPSRRIVEVPGRRVAV